MSLGFHSVSAVLRRAELSSAQSVSHSLHGHLSHIPSMSVTNTLHGHLGCVNRLALSEDGEKLISASDDCTLRIWDVASLSERAVLAPGHFSNVFGVAFMPGTSDGYVVSAGLDYQVRHTNVHTAASTLWNCHDNVVKTVTAVTPHVFISASHDGNARQFDVRVPPYHPKYRASSVIVRIVGRDRRVRELNCAQISPMSENHLLVAGNEPCLRIYDRRKCASFVERGQDDDDDESALGTGAIGDCLEKLTPPHMQEGAPEISGLGGLKKTYATFATYSPDARQVVASFYDDFVHVFDLPQHTMTSCQKPFMSARQLKEAVDKILQDGVCYASQSKHSMALAKMERVLLLQQDNLFALMVKADALARRNCFGDLRRSFDVLETVCALVKEDRQKLTQLVGEGEERIQIWLRVFKYMQASALFKLNPWQQVRLMRPGHARSEFTRRRMEELDAVTDELKAFVDKTFRNSEEPARKRAMAEGRSEMGLKEKVLHRMFDGFYKGLPGLREGIRTLLSHLADLREETELVCVEADLSSTDSDDYLAEEKLEALELMENRDTENGMRKMWGRRVGEEGWRCYEGHTSVQTDIKEARFYGAKNQVVMSGSDDGNVYMWASDTGELLSQVHADEHIVNCVLPHPTRSMVIASGIDRTIKVLTPQKRRRAAS